MMNAYGAIAVIAAVDCQKNGTKPSDAWKKFADAYYGLDSGVTRPVTEKAGPRNTFIALCNLGFVPGVRRSLFDSSRIKENAGYAEKAVEILRGHPELCRTPTELWPLVHPTLEHQGQMDVVCALFDAGLLTISP